MRCRFLTSKASLQSASFAEMAVLSRLMVSCAECSAVSEHAQDMSGLVRRARLAGVRTALLSNSWGDQYLRDGWQDMFDAVVISGEVGMRKPERADLRAHPC